MIFFLKKKFDDILFYSNESVVFSSVVMSVLWVGIQVAGYNNDNEKESHVIRSGPP